jgi:hypothetical protein
LFFATEHLSTPRKIPLQEKGQNLTQLQKWHQKKLGCIKKCDEPSFNLTPNVEPN